MDLEQVLPELFRELESTYSEMVSDKANRENIAEGDIVTRIDKKMTDVVTDFFPSLEPEFAVQSEELSKSGEEVSAENPDYTVIFDEIDGTHNMRDQVGSFGPIVAVAEGKDPVFRDVVLPAS